MSCFFTPFNTTPKSLAFTVPNILFVSDKAFFWVWPAFTTNYSTIYKTAQENAVGHAHDRRRVNNDEAVKCLQGIEKVFHPCWIQEFGWIWRCGPWRDKANAFKSCRPYQFPIIAVKFNIAGKVFREAVLLSILKTLWSLGFLKSASIIIRAYSFSKGDGNINADSRFPLPSSGTCDEYCLGRLFRWGQ